MPGPTGNWGNFFKIKNSLKAEGFSFNRDKKLWYRSSAPAEKPDVVAAFNLGGVKLRGVSQWADVASSVCLLALLDVASFYVNCETDGRVRWLIVHSRSHGRCLDRRRPPASSSRWAFGRYLDVALAFVRCEILPFCF